MVSWSLSSCCCLQEYSGAVPASSSETQVSALSYLTLVLMKVIPYLTFFFFTFGFKISIFISVVIVGRKIIREMDLFFHFVKWMQKSLLEVYHDERDHF